MLRRLVATTCENAVDVHLWFGAQARLRDVSAYSESSTSKRAFAFSREYAFYNAWMRVRGPARFLIAAGLVILATSACDRSPADRPNEKSDIALPAEVRVLTSRVTPGATLSSLLHAEQIAEHEIAELVGRAASVFDVRKLRTDRPYRVIRAITGVLRGFEYEIDTDRVLRLSRPDAGKPFIASIDGIDKRTETRVAVGAIDRETPSLFEAMSHAGERVDLAMALAATLGSEVDFNTELQPGDRFRVLVDKQYRLADDGEGRHEDTFVKYGDIHAVVLENAGRTIEAVRFTPHNGTADYFDRNGRSLHRFFLKSPLKFDPIVTSRFSMSRLHPVIGEVRAHLGVDFRAPTGAPVIAVADGVVLSAGYAGGAGRMVHLRHANGFETEYLHLSAIDVRAGTRVRQGEVIGKVGSSGLATGPHLDYRVRRDGTFVNPTAVHQAMPPGDPIADGDRREFEELRDRVLAALNAASKTPMQSTDND